MTLEIYEFDPAEYLTTPDEIEAYLKSAIDEGSPEEIADAEAVAGRARARLARRQTGG